MGRHRATRKAHKQKDRQMEQKNIFRNFHVIEGGLHAGDKNSSHRFISAWITDTRLMGVCCVKAHWLVETPEESLDMFQFFYFDWQEYGLETFECFRGRRNLEMKESVAAVEQGLSAGLGGEKNPVSERELRFLVQSFVEFNERSGIPLPKKLYEFDFLLTPKINLSDEEHHALICKECTKLSSPFQVINYFLMRCFARDFEGAKLLTKNYVRTDLFASFAAADMLRNSIKEDDETTGSNSDYYATGSDSDFGTFSTRKSYLCESLLEFDAKYYLAVTRITLEGLKVVKYEKLSSFRISLWEASLMLNQPEYVTVYDAAGELSGFDIEAFPLLKRSMVSEHECGKLFAVYYPNNDHLHQPIYYMYDDLFGICYVLENGQIVLASRSRENIIRLETQLMGSKYGPLLVLVSKYEFNHSVIHDFVNRNYEDFEDFLSDLGVDE